MAGTNPNYVAQPGDVFGTPAGAVTVKSGYGQSFFDTQNRAYGTQSRDVGLMSTPNVQAVANLAAAETNTGSGVITGVSVNNPAVNPNPNGDGAPGGFGPYTITYTAEGYEVTNAADEPVGFNIVVTTIEGDALSVDAATLGCIVIRGVPVPTQLSFLGLTVQISGSPAVGDSFTVTPNA
jgi:hypothetical protein